MPFLLINKAAGWTSLDVVAKLRGLIHIERIGHAGTLDPFATGLLIVAVTREATKRLDEFKNLEKEYEVELKFGATSDTYDCDGEITIAPNSRAISRDELAAALEHYRGSIQQIPPMYSAKKIGGKRLHDLARQGIEVERKPQTVTISELEILDSTPEAARLRVVCSPGTYIRSLVHDLGQDLGVGAYAIALKRTRIGNYKLEHAHTLDEVAAQRIGWQSLVVEV